MFLNFFSFLTMSFEGQKFFQSASSELMAAMMSLHNDIMFAIIVILIFVLWSLWRIIYFYNAKRFYTYMNYCLISFCGMFPDLSDKLQFIKKNNPMKDSIKLSFTHHTLLEQIWTLMPTLILFSILLPSMTLIYMMDNVFDNSPQSSALITLKMIGNQWYWTYQTSNGCLAEPMTFDSYLDNTIVSGKIIDGKYIHGARPLRLLQVDKEVYLPINTKMSLLITSNDVIHSWAMPSCAIKMDAVPGRVNSTGLEVTSFGSKMGQCSELCGTGHAFMPMVVRVVPLAEYLSLVCGSF